MIQDLVQAQVQLRGYVYNISTGKAIENATIEFKGKRTYRTLSDSLGIFSFRQGTSGVFTFKITHVSYYPVEQEFNLQRDTVLHFYLQPASDSLMEVKVTARNIKSKSANVQLSYDDISLNGSVLGEANVYEALQRQAGIIHTNAFNTGLYVRGLGTGNTGVLLDGINTFGGNHLLGIYPNVNADAFASVQLLKEDIHPQYSGYLSSYLVMETENRISDSIKGKAEIGILTTKASVRFPIVRKKVGLITNIRRSYFDVVSNTYNNINRNKEDYSPLPSYGFYDWNNTLIVDPGKAGAFKLNTFYSSDRLRMDNHTLQLNADWKNWSTGVSWQYPINKKTQLKINAGHSEYSANTEYLSLLKQMKNRISESSLQGNLNWQAGDHISLDYGIYAKYSTLSMHSRTQNETDASTGNITIQEMEAQNLGGYIFATLTSDRSYHVKLGSKLEYYRSDKSFITASPTLNVQFNLPKQSILFDISRRVQFSHLYVPTGIQLPMNIWYPSTRQAPPENAWQIATTYSRSFGKKLKGSISAYYIFLDNQIEFLDKNYFTALDFKTSIGKGISKGIEFNLYYDHKKLGVESYYTLGKSTCQFSDINNGKEYSLPYDIRHKADLSFSWKWHRNWLFSISQFIQSGFLITMPTGIYLNQDADGRGIAVREVPIYTDRNNYRMPLFHRMDVSIKNNFSIKKVKCSWTAGTFNTYGYQNPYFIYFSMDMNEQNQTFLRARKKSLLPLVPFINIQAEF